MSNNKTTKCPSCGFEIDVNELLHKEIEAEYQATLAGDRETLRQQGEAIKKQQAELDSTIESRVSSSLKEEKANLERKLRASLEQDQGELIKGLQEQLTNQSQKIADLNRAKLEVEKLKQEKATLRSEIELDLEKKLAQELSAQAEKMHNKASEKFTLQVAEKEQVINQLREQLNIAQRKAEQGSTQLQGEAQELVIEDWLRVEFPQDLVEEVKKGQLGADTLQTVNGAIGQPSGTIYYESKRTKAFQPAWIAKFKEDIQAKGADIGVLVTQVLPDGIDSLGQIDGVWVCSFAQFKPLSRVLRDTLMQVNNALTVSSNKGDKMGLLYDFLTGSEFRMQIEAIVEGFSELKADLEREKRSMQGLWKRREKQLDRVLLNTNFMYNSIKGIAGNAVQEIPSLELHNDESD